MPRTLLPELLTHREEKAQGSEPCPVSAVAPPLGGRCTAPTGTAPVGTSYHLPAGLDHHLGKQCVQRAHLPPGLCCSKPLGSGLCPRTQQRCRGQGCWLRPQLRPPPEPRRACLQSSGRSPGLLGAGSREASSPPAPTLRLHLLPLGSGSAAQVPSHNLLKLS